MLNLENYKKTAHSESVTVTQQTKLCVRIHKTVGHFHALSIQIIMDQTYSVLEPHSLLRFYPKLGSLKDRQPFDRVKDSSIPISWFWGYKLCKFLLKCWRIGYISKMLAYIARLSKGKVFFFGGGDEGQAVLILVWSLCWLLWNSLQYPRSVMQYNLSIKCIYGSSNCMKSSPSELSSQEIFPLMSLSSRSGKCSKFANLPEWVCVTSRKSIACWMLVLAKVLFSLSGWSVVLLMQGYWYTNQNFSAYVIANFKKYLNMVLSLMATGQRVQLAGECTAYEKRPIEDLNAWCICERRKKLRMMSNSS